MTARKSRIARILDARDEILGGDSSGGAYLHSLLAQCALPYREPPEGATEYKRSNGRASVVIQRGYLMNPTTGALVAQGLPYGARPRLLMIHACTEAVRLQSPTVPIADSMSGFMKQLGLAVTGGAHGTIARFKDQVNRLAASRIQLLYRGDRGATVLNSHPFARLELWFPEDPRQRTLWPSELQLSAEFFESLMRHALPLDVIALRALQGSARALDVYVWLAHRLPRVRAAKGDLVSWSALFTQFGGELSDQRNFRKKFLAALREASSVYPGARIEQLDAGLRLFPSPTAVPRKI